MKVGLYFGSFNPVHVGHMIIANHMVNNTDMDQLWMVVSPHNPLKQKKTLAKDYDRLHLLNLAIGDLTNIKASDIEFKLPKPSYTIDTMVYLEEKYPQHQFCLIMGGDNLASFHKWKNYEKLLENYPIYVYRRPNYDLPEIASHENIILEEAPLLDISASFIRSQIRSKKSIKYLVPDKVYEYLLEDPIYNRLDIQ
ncbi:MAG: nicotinate-nucleotide adenylyltransferase [Saprospiraceae bacterium]|nr:nicotinate-nucleotide adenylyltransferase [Bacteroidia bacterium]NNE15019.1 nicotinate-nucleotide adenylyltransferase [Saprospiraceae bacterium]NNL91327.1 nicotinate-nucleotide adenylyltransferase [Saprospiraceae bacterium]